MSLGHFQLNHYRTLDEGSPEWGQEADTETLLRRDGSVIARVGRKFREQLEQQGSARLRDGRVINAEEKIKGRWRYLIIRNAPFGIGAPGHKLMPYRTVAVNSTEIPIGTVLFVPALIGVKLPNGDLHDGFVFAHDMSDARRGKKLQLFIGFDSNMRAISGIDSPTSTVHVYRADEDAAAVLNRRFKMDFYWEG